MTVIVRDDNGDDDDDDERTRMMMLTRLSLYHILTVIVLIFLNIRFKSSVRADRSL